MHNSNSMCARGHLNTATSRWLSLSSRLAITHISRPQVVNPKGIPSLSPGLRAASYPGGEASKDSATLKGLKPPTRRIEARQALAPRYNPFRVVHASGTQPRVARGSQPWAGGCNPVGIEKRLPDLWGKVSPQRRRGRVVGWWQCQAPGLTAPHPSALPGKGAYL